MTIKSKLSGAERANERVVSLGDGLPSIPERLLLAHARGEVLFVAGAGVSMPAGLPSFRSLVRNVYEKLDAAVHAVLPANPKDDVGDVTGLTHAQTAEVRRFLSRDFDVVLGMLERRMDDQPGGGSRVRHSIAQILRGAGSAPAAIHKALMRLADRGASAPIVTTNFDALLQLGSGRGSKPRAHALGGIPRPSRGQEFSGVLHIHGALERDAQRLGDFGVTDQDFGEFYLRRRTVPDFLYDAARLYHLVLVGYSADDPPMRYLLNAIAADGVRFDDLKERFTLFGMEEPDPVVNEDWKGRGITPITYDSANDHLALLGLLQRWADLSAINGRPEYVAAEVRRIVRSASAGATDSDRDIFEHLLRRANHSQRLHLAELASKLKADVGWLNTIAAVALEHQREAA